MSNMRLKYGLEEKPPAGELLLYGLQWLAITVPTIIIVGNVVAGLHFHDQPGGQVVYLQKLFFIAAAVMFVQLLYGHRLPLITGPAAVLLVGIVAARASDTAAVYSAVLLGGVILFTVGALGLFRYLAALFTPRVVAVILLLIAFTLVPTITGLVLPDRSPVPPPANLGFALALLFLLLWAGRVLTGVWKSTLIIWGVIGGSLVYLLFFPAARAVGTDPVGGMSAAFLVDIIPRFSLEPGLLLSFLVCFLALSINDLGSMQSVGELLKPGDMAGRITRGITISGLANALSGLLGVIGPVNYSLSPGIIASTGCASRFTLLPAAAGLAFIAFLPPVIYFFGLLPQPVIGTVLVYVMCSQVAAGLLVAFGTGGLTMEDGLVMGMSLMLGLVVSFLPAQVVGTFPAALRPVLGNGFVVGVLAVLVMEHVVYRKGKVGAAGA